MLCNYAYRYYNPTTGRWLSRDPIGEDESCNLYIFIQNNGLHNLDLYGLISLIEKDQKILKRDCGGFTISRNWWIEDAAAELSHGKSGYLIQNMKITVEFAVDCNGVDLGVLSNSFSEYWGPITEDGRGGLRLPPLKKGQKSDLQQVPSDIFESPSWGKSCGALVIEASAAVYILGSAPSGYTVKGRPPSGALPHRDKYSYVGMPNSNIITVKKRISWNCCP
jgi:hypothetical protein